MSHFCNLVLKAVAICVVLHNAVCSQLSYVLHIKKKSFNMLRLPHFTEDAPCSPLVILMVL